MILRSTLAYGIKNGIGVFCLLETREQQDNDKSPLAVVGKAISLHSFQGKNDRPSGKIWETFFLKITISIICNITTDCGFFFFIILLVPQLMLVWEFFHLKIIGSSNCCV